MLSSEFLGQVYIDMEYETVESRTAVFVGIPVKRESLWVGFQSYGKFFEVSRNTVIDLNPEYRKPIMEAFRGENKRLADEGKASLPEELLTEVERYIKAEGDSLSRKGTWGFCRVSDGKKAEGTLREYILTTVSDPRRN